jgi:hypothetical protein
MSCTNKFNATRKLRERDASFGTYAVSVVPRAPEIWPLKTVQELLLHPVYPIYPQRHACLNFCIAAFKRDVKNKLLGP